MSQKTCREPLAICWRCSDLLTQEVCCPIGHCERPPAVRYCLSAPEVGTGTSQTTTTLKTRHFYYQPRMACKDGTKAHSCTNLHQMGHISTPEHFLYGHTVLESVALQPHHFNKPAHKRQLCTSPSRTRPALSIREIRYASLTTYYHTIIHTHTHTLTKITFTVNGEVVFRLPDQFLSMVSSSSNTAPLS